MRPQEFRKVYDRGAKFSCSFFAAFYLNAGDQSGPQVGFTTPRALGKSVVRNRLKRRLREAVRMHLTDLSGGWQIVINPRRGALDAPMPDLEREVMRLFLRCRNS